MYCLRVSSTSLGKTTFYWFCLRHSVNYLSGFIYGRRSFKIWSTFSCVKALFIINIYSAIKTTAKSGSSATKQSDVLLDLKIGST